MPRLQDFKTPLVFKFDDQSPTAALNAPDDAKTFRVEVRALEGMQKEATVRQSERSGQAWRMVSDEGP